MPTSGKTNISETTRHELQTRRVHEIIELGEFEKRLKSGRPLLIKFGRDPRVPTLHLGHSIPLRKLREFQRAGHRIVIVLGDFTARLGDPNDDKAREIMSEEEIEANVVAIRKIFDKILDPKATEYVKNSKWLSNLNFGDVIKLASNFTVQQNIDRDLFKRRIAANKPVGVHEFLYPIMQAYDSVMLKCDLEVGGTDQTFNLLAGRTLMRAFGLAPQDILTTPMLLGLDGREMHSSWGNFVPLTDSAVDMYGKLMGIRDELIVNYLELTTEMSEAEIKTVKNQLKLSKISPLDAKKLLAREVVSLYHGTTAAQQAEQEFESVVQGKGLPEEVIVGSSWTKAMPLPEYFYVSGATSSRSEGVRLIEQGGVVRYTVDKHTGEIENRSKVSPLNAFVEEAPKGKKFTYKVGKRKAVEQP